MPYVRTGAVDAYQNTYYPYNFICLLADDGMLIIDTASMAQYAPTLHV